MNIHSYKLNNNKNVETGKFLTPFISFMSRVRGHMLGGFFFGVFLPSLLFNLFHEGLRTESELDNTIIGTSTAFVFGYLIFRKVTALPGFHAAANIVPAFILSYGGVAVLYFGLRLDFGRQEFFLSFIFISCFFLFLLFYLGRFRRPVLGVVPFGNAKDINQITRIAWRRLDTPQDAKKYEHLSLVADLRAPDLPVEWQTFLADAAVEGRWVFNAKQIKESLTGKVQIEHLAQNPAGHLSPDSLYLPSKFYVDFLAALIAIIILSPLMLIIAIFIRLTSPGPAIFKQKRQGYRGHEFTMYKFRSMHMEEELEGGQKGENKDASQIDSSQSDKTQSGDVRVTSIGKYIRKTRLDELPQLFNILKGEMSWIGPRPETVALSQRYETVIPFYRYRHVVRPGITGWAQVKQGHVIDDVDVSHKLEYDFYYIKNFSIWLDLLILFQTVKVVVTGYGAK